jgi:hypothetical protein
MKEGDALPILLAQKLWTGCEPNLKVMDRAIT